MTSGEGYWKTWATLLLAGPTIWIAHFWAVYLTAEVGCVYSTTIGGWPAVSFVTVVATIMAIVAIGLVGLRAVRGGRTADDHTRPLFSIGALLAGLSIIATLLVGLPAVLLSPC